MPERSGVAVTRAADDAPPLAAALEAVGLRPILTPLLHVVPGDIDVLADRLASGRYDWLVCTSRHAVASLAAAMASQGLSAEALHVARVGAVGPSTAAALEALGLAVDLRPDQADAEHLAQAMLSQARSRTAATREVPMGAASAPTRVLFPRAREARDALPSILRGAGWQVIDVPVYETRDDAPGGPRLVEALRQGTLAAVTLASGSAARAFARVVPPMLWSSARLVSIGPTTTATARAAGLTVSAEAATPDMTALADAARRILLQTPTHA